MLEQSECADCGDDYECSWHRLVRRSREIRSTDRWPKTDSDPE